jgi:spore coat protein U-like protein
MNTFYVQANASTKCLINSKSNIDFGNTPSSANNIESKGTNPINLTCTNGTVYNIGLAPSNDNKDGAGVMKGSGGNSDLVPYQLRSTPSLSGTPWGNTATSTSLGNGVMGTGTGTAQNKSVYVTVPSADFKPDTYSDIVTINVNY